MDILVLVDNSSDTAEEQATLAMNFPLLLDSILDPPLDPVTGLPVHVPVDDLHIGVIDQNVGTGGYVVETCDDPVDGDNGELQHTPSSTFPPGTCDPPYPPYLEYDCTGTACPDEAAIYWMSVGFGCIGILGHEGCGMEQPLESARRSLIDNMAPGGPNAGFLREDSILMIIWLSDEDDCSVAPGNEEFFDSTSTEMGPIQLRCFRYPEMLVEVDDYIEAFRSLRDDPGKLLQGFIVGVPKDPACEGSGDAIAGCLDHPDMQETIDPLIPSRILPGCREGIGGLAAPPRRLVEVALEFGPSARVVSICNNDLRSAIDSFASMLHEAVDAVPDWIDPVAASADPGDPCLCLAPCRVVEALSDTRACEPGRPCWETEPGESCAPPWLDPDGNEHTLCEIPQAGTRMDPCGLSCDEEGVAHEAEGAGWYYLGPGWIDEAGRTVTDPEIRATGGFEPAAGSDVYVACCM